jgi:hypothetical protein
MAAGEKVAEHLRNTITYHDQVVLLLGQPLEQLGQLSSQPRKTRRTPWALPWLSVVPYKSQQPCSTSEEQQEAGNALQSCRA